jgi:URI fold toxin 2
MSKHKNSYENEEEQHLYEIIDTERDDIFKYGICAKPLNADGSSARANEQTSFLNSAVGWFRFYANVIISGIMGRIAARELEDDYIENYKVKNGEYPPGNKNHKKLKK